MNFVPSNKIFLIDTFYISILVVIKKYYYFKLIILDILNI